MIERGLPKAFLEREIKNDWLTPEEKFVLTSFPLISGKKFNDLSGMLVPDVTFIDPHFSPRPITGRKEVVEALTEGFRNIHSINFEVEALNTMKDPSKIQSSVMVGVFTTTTTTVVTPSDELSEMSVRQAFLFKVGKLDGNMVLTHVEAFPQYPPPNEMGGK